MSYLRPIGDEAEYGDDVDGDTIHRFTFMTMMRMLLGEGILGMRMFG